MSAWRAVHSLLRSTTGGAKLLQPANAGAAAYAGQLCTVSSLSTSTAATSAQASASSTRWCRSTSTSSQQGSSHSSAGAAWGAAGFAAGATTLLAATSSVSLADAQPAGPLAPSSSATTPPGVDPYDKPAPTGYVPKQLTLYQYEVCPFCCKVKAFLDYHNVPYEVVEVNPLTKSELRSWCKEHKKVPVVKLDNGTVMADSSLIISTLAAELEAASQQVQEAVPAPQRKGWLGLGGSKAESKAVPAGGSAAEERVWRKWVDDRLVKVITANIYRSWDEAWQSFGYITDNTKWAWGTQQAARTSGAIIMWRVGKKMPAKYGIEGDLRQALYNDVDLFVTALNGRDFMGGSKPNMADLAVFGVLRAVQGTPTYTDVLAHTSVGPWLMRMTVAVGDSSRVNA